MFTIRTDRLLTLLAFVVSMFVLLTVVRLFFPLLGAVELTIITVLALVMTVFVSRLLRSALGRHDRPA